MSTDAGNRDKVLKATNSNSVALKYKDIAPMKRAERSALVKGMDVVYIYHDKVDEARIIMCGSFKGGVGKNANSWNLAYSLAEMGKRVLAVDFDS